jgi:hypothetical protein
LFVRENRLLLQRLDPNYLTAAGDPVSVAEDVDVVPDTGAAQFTVGGSLLFFREWDGGRRFQWADPQGLRLAAIDAEPVRMGANGFSLAPTDDRIALTRVGPDSPVIDISILNLQTGDYGRVTSTPESEGWPCWSPDARRLAFTRTGQLIVVPVGRTGEEQAIRVGGGRRCSWTRDERIVVGGQGGIAIVDAAGNVQPLGGTGGFIEGVSADGETVALTATDRGGGELFVVSLADPKRVQQVASFGRAARWSRTGRDLYFFADGRAWKVAIGADLSVSTPFDVGLELVTANEVVNGWDIALDGRFLLSVVDRRTTLTGILNWQSTVRSRQ